MSKKSSPTPPPAPDPAVVANAQANANIAAAQAQQKLNLVDAYGPDGSVTWGADPDAPGGYAQTTTLSPSQQAIYDALTQAQGGALGVANQQIGRVADALGQGLTAPQLQTQVAAPGAIAAGYAPGGPVLSGYDPGGQIQSGFSRGPGLALGFDPGQAVQGHVGPQDLSGAYGRAADASYGQAASRLDPQWAEKQQQLQDQLANQGLGVSSDAYAKAMRDFGQQENDAYNQADFSAQQQGLNAENALFGQALAQGQFANQAAAQEYAQNQGEAAFRNAAAGQGFGQNLAAMQAANQAQAQGNAENQAAAQFANQAQAQRTAQDQAAAGFANDAQNQAFQQALAGALFANQAAGQGFQQDAYAQELPINELTALMGSGQVALPQGFGYAAAQVSPANVLGAYQLQSQAQNQAYQSQLAQQNALTGGLFGLGSSILGAGKTPWFI